MSNLVFPTLPGLSFGIKKAPIWKTNVQSAASGRQDAQDLFSSPLYRFELPFAFLRAHARYGEFQALYGLVQKLRGRFDTFLYEDPDDHRAENELIGVGDGVTRSFILSRTYCGFSEPIAHADVVSIATAPTMWDEDDSTPMWSGDGGDPMWAGGADLGAFTVSGSVITFDVAPPAAEEVRWSGQFYYRCRLNSDEQQFTKFMQRRWEGSMQFTGDLSGKIT